MVWIVRRIRAPRSGVAERVAVGLCSAQAGLYHVADCGCDRVHPFTRLARRGAKIIRRLPVLLCLLCTAACAGGGARVRVAFDKAGVSRVEAHGWADRAARRRVTADDPVRIASISKLVAAIGPTMRLNPRDP
ncbi:MAG: hypothetical protein EOP59_16020, partial [Sphingomonadales bacterium]